MADRSGLGYYRAMENTLHYGPLTFVIHENGLQILPNRDGYHGPFEIADIEEAYHSGEYTGEQLLNDALSCHFGALCNGWDRFTAEELGALTGCDLIISPDISRGDDGEIDGWQVGGMVYWHERYAVECPLEALFSPDGLWLQGTMLEEAPDNA